MDVEYRIFVTVIALVFWFLSQKWIGRRKIQNSEMIFDLVHQKTESLNLYLQKNEKLAKFLLISSSFLIDVSGLYLLYEGIFGSSMKPLIGLIILFFFRQLNQVATALPIPRGMIWKDPQVPSIFVTYGVSNDLFFSGHTALITYTMLQILTLNQPLLSALFVAIFIYEVVVVLVLRAHWTLDVVTGALAAVCVFLLVNPLNL